MNESENFNPVGARRNLSNEILPSPGGTTEEWGVMLDLFEGKFSARMNFFETQVTGSTFDVLNGASNSIVTLPNQWANRYITAFNEWSEDPNFTTEAAAIAAFEPSLIDAGLDTYDKILQHIFTLQPESIQALTNYRTEIVNGETEVRFDNIEGLAATTDFIAEGWELELVGNPIPILDEAFFDEAEIRGDVFFGYRRRIFDDSVDWKLQLNIRNAFGPDDPIPVWTNPDGQVAVVRVPPTTEVFLTNTFRF
ncbi:MAG: hypothetical protein ACREIA_12170 [Opitutaceae bacterium]